MGEYGCHHKVVFCTILLLPQTLLNISLVASLYNVVDLGHLLHNICY